MTDLYRLPFGAGGSQISSRTVARRKPLTRRKQKKPCKSTFFISAQKIHFGATVPYRIPQYPTVQYGTVPYRAEPRRVEHKTEFQRTIRYRTVRYSTVPYRAEATGVASEPQARPSVPYDPYGTLGG